MSYNSFKAHKRVAWVQDKKRGEMHNLPHRFAFELRPEFIDRDGIAIFSYETIKECEDHVIRNRKPVRREDIANPLVPIPERKQADLEEAIAEKRGGFEKALLKDGSHIWLTPYESARGDRPSDAVLKRRAIEMGDEA